MNVKLPLSSRAPELPARTTLSSVKSETVAELKVVSAPVIVAPALPSISPPNVPTPATLTLPAFKVFEDVSKFKSASVPALVIVPDVKLVVTIL